MKDDQKEDEVDIAYYTSLSLSGDDDNLSLSRLTSRKSRVFISFFDQQGAYLMIVAGAIMMVIAFFGCFGAIRESQCLLTTFFISLFLVLALCVALLVILFVEPHLTDKVTKPVSHGERPNQINKYRGGTPDATSSSTLILSLILMSFGDFRHSKTAIFVVRN